MARDIYSKHALDWEWWDSAFDAFKDVGALMGWDIADIYFSGFCSQGDGACFVGHMAYNKGCAKEVRAYAPNDTELHRIADHWQALQKRCFYGLRATVTKMHCHYSHENTVSIDCESGRYRWQDIPAHIEDECSGIARDFMRWIYRQLEQEHAYQSAWQLAQGWQELAGDMTESRASARQLVADMRAARKAGLAAATSICNALRQQLRAYAEQWEAARQEREEIAESFYYWQDGARQDVSEFAAANL